MAIVGRDRETAALDLLLKAPEADFLIIYGRRRVGKTFLIREHFKKHLAFELTGLIDTSLTDQLARFHKILVAKMRRKSLPVPKSWMEAFDQLRDFLDSLPKNRKHVIFLDELPWLASPRSKFLPALDHFWNTYLSRHKQFLLVGCGSAASWMISKILNNKGGLHNRVTARIRLEPFSLAETEAYFKARRVKLTRYEILTLSMACGGIPHYLKQVQRGESASQSIERLCFTTGGLLREEFPRLYHSLFDGAERHLEIVRLLAAKPQGLTRADLTSSYSSGGGLTRLLTELTEAGFVSATLPFEKRKKDTLYRLCDEYSIFYLRWIEARRLQAGDNFTKIITTPSWRAWSGYALESLAKRHFPQILRGLGIRDVASYESSWIHRPDETWPDGAQVDLLIDRADQSINLMEIKFSQAPFIITKAYAETLRNRLQTFQEVTRTRKNTFVSFLTTHGVKENKYSRELVHQQVTIDVLFES